MIAEILVILAVAVVLQLSVWEALRWTTRGLVRHVPRWRGWQRVHPVRAALAERLPRLWPVVEGRFDPNHFSGLPLTLMVLGAGYLSFAFLGVVDMVRETQGVVAFDARVFELCAPFRSPEHVSLAMKITGLGDGSALVAVLFVTTGFLFAHRRIGLAGPMWIGFIGVEIATTLGKWGLNRARPEFTVVAIPTSPSFPSGHTTGAAFVYGFIAYAMARDLASPRRRFGIGYWAIVIIALVGISRVFLGVHFPSDVLAGWIIGAFWLLVAFAVAEHGRHRRSRAEAARCEAREEAKDAAETRAPQ